MVAARGVIIDRDVEVFLKGNTPKERSAELAAFALEQDAEAQAMNRKALGRTPDRDVTVDGRPGAPVASVRPGGTIIFDYDLFGPMFVWIAALLEKNSPRRSGRYARSHQLYADGTPVEPLTAPEDAAEYAFVSAVPYARKLEAGLSRQAPDGVYEVVALMAQRRFGNVARIRFSYRSLAGSDRNPALVITPR